MLFYNLAQEVLFLCIYHDDDCCNTSHYLSHKKACENGSLSLGLNNFVWVFFFFFFFFLSPVNPLGLCRAQRSHFT